MSIYEYVGFLFDLFRTCGTMKRVFNYTFVLPYRYIIHLHAKEECYM